MLQPPQLTDVASRYAAEIVELRAFLAKAGVPVNTSQAVAVVASRVQVDRAFHRDLMATLWVITEGEDRQIGFADLLGVLAIASAGVTLAADSEEQDALALLQFFKDIRPTRKSPAKDTANAGNADPAMPHRTRTLEESVQEHGTSQPGTGIEKSLSLESPRPSPPEPQSFMASPRTRTPWFVAGLCLLFVCILTLWFRRQSVATQPDIQRGAGAGASSSSSPLESPNATTAPFRQGAGRVSSAPRPEAHRPAGVGTQEPAIPDQLATTSNAPVHAPAQTSLASVSHGDDASSTKPADTQVSAIRPQSSPGNAGPLNSIVSAKTTTQPAIMFPVPASTLSKRLGTPALPQYAPGQGGQGIADAPRRPRLLRRHSTSIGDPGLVAELQPIDNPATRAPQSAGTQAGSVRPTALGIMAGNVLFSPTPPYPAAASAAHVTGEVKLEAQIDRDGTVTYARVVSGPPLLRDAALNAMQQWKYRPYLSRGKAVPVTTLAIIDFQLP